MNDEIRDRLQQGADLMALRKYQEAKELYQDILREDRDDIEVYLNLGNACMDLEQFDEGIDAFKRALLIDEDSVTALYSLAYAYFLDGDYEQAARLFNRIEEIGQASVDLYSVMAAMFLDAEDYGMAVRSLNRAIKLDPLNAQLRLQKAQAYLQMGKVREAVSSLRDLQEILPDEAAGYIMEAQVLIDVEEFDGALEALGRAIARFPGDAILSSLRAQALNSMGRYEEALAEAIRAADLETDVPEVKNQVSYQTGIALGGLGRVDESVAVLERAAREGAGAEALFLLMNECVALKRYDRALEASRRIEALDDVAPRHMGAAVFYEALCTERLGHAEEALTLYREAVRRLRGLTIGRNGLYDLYAYRALCHKSLGEYDQALKLLDYLAKLDDNSAGVYALKASVLDAAGRAQEAAQMRARAHSIDPTIEFGE